MNIKLNIKSLEDLQKKLKNSQKKLKEYDGKHTITLPYSEEQWNKMTEYEKQQVKEQVINEYKDSIIKDLNGK